MPSTKSIPSFKKDMRFGARSEKEFAQIMKRRFNLNLIKTRGNCFYDYTLNGNILIELKSRRVTRARYDSTIIGLNKIQSFDRMNRHQGGNYRLFMVFHFTDSICFQEHVAGDRYSISEWKRNPRTGIEDKVKPYVFLPTRGLRPIRDLPKMIKPKPKKPRNKFKVINNLSLI